MIPTLLVLFLQYIIIAVPELLSRSLAFYRIFRSVCCEDL